MNSSIPTKNQCHLLMLPRELRDMIYEYVYYEPLGLLASPTSLDPHDPAKRAIVKTNSYHLYKCEKFFSKREKPDSLREVCRQLRAETFGMSVLLNKLTVDKDYRTDKIHFLDFLDQCSPAFKSKLREVVVTLPTSYRGFESEMAANSTWKAYVNDNMDDRIVDFCRQNPKAQVGVKDAILFEFGPHKPSPIEVFVVFANAMCKVLYDTTPFRIHDGAIEKQEQCTAELATKFPQSIPINLKFVCPIRWWGHFDRDGVLAFFSELYPSKEEAQEATDRLENFHYCGFRGVEEPARQKEKWVQEPLCTPRYSPRCLQRVYHQHSCPG